MSWWCSVGSGRYLKAEAERASTNVTKPSRELYLRVMLDHHAVLAHVHAPLLHVIRGRRHAQAQQGREGLQHPVMSSLSESFSAESTPKVPMTVAQMPSPDRSGESVFQRCSAPTFGRTNAARNLFSTDRRLNELVLTQAEESTSSSISWNSLELASRHAPRTFTVGV